MSETNTTEVIIEPVKEKNPGGRPTKINDNIIKAFNDVLYDPNSINAIILTDRELVGAVNMNLRMNGHLDDMFSYGTFRAWKSLYSKRKTLKDETSLYNVSKYTEILVLIKDALITQKQGLFLKLATDDKAWTRWAWIIERKFDNWNLKQKVENKNDNINKVEIEIIRPKHETLPENNRVDGQEPQLPIENSN